MPVDLVYHIDDEFDEVTAGQEENEPSAIARKCTQLGALVGAAMRLNTGFDDILKHLNERVEAIRRKAMIVCMSRQICVSACNRIFAAGPDWHGDTDDTGVVKVTMTGNAFMQPLLWSKSRQEVFRNQFTNA